MDTACWNHFQCGGRARADVGEPAEVPSGKAQPTRLGWQNVDNALRVETSEGTILCKLLVNAAGPWAGTLGGLPLTPMNRHLFVTGPVDWAEPNLPCVWDGNLGLYFRPESGGLLLSCCDETPASPGDYQEDPAVLDQLARKLASSQPGLGDLSIRHKWVGQRVFAPDRRFAIGFDPRCDRVFHVAALGGHGVTASHEVGRLAASLIIDHATDNAKTLDPASPFNPATPFDPARLLPNSVLTK
ncbi:MAG: FAD-binding oxidoreductase [Planctomycetes bacterium]|nr:FAD-binding oxidoreductase [Planctomycetota bacterium]